MSALFSDSFKIHTAGTSSQTGAEFFPFGKTSGCMISEKTGTMKTDNFSMGKL